VEELREVLAPLASFLDSAFKPSRFNQVPFLRGVYLTSARPQGQPVSQALRRLGQPWAQSAARGGERGGWFARDLFAEIIAGDTNLVIPTSRIAPLPQRLILGGSWSAYWHNGFIYSHDIQKGMDVLEIKDTRTDPAKFKRVWQNNAQTPDNSRDG